MPEKEHPSQPERGLGALALPVIRPIPARTLVAGVSVTMLLAAVFSFYVEVPRREYVSGWMEPVGGEIRIVAPSSGTLAGLPEPGTELTRGQAIASLRDSRTAQGASVAAVQSTSFAANLDAVAGEVASLQREQSEREAALQRQIVLARSAVERARAEALARRDAAVLQQAEIDRSRSLVASGFLSSGRLEQLQSQQRLQQADAEAAKRAELLAQQQLEALQADLAQSRSRAAVALSEKRRLSADLAAQKTLADSAGQVELTAPVDSVILANAASNGSTISAGQLLSVLAMRNAPMQATLLVPAAAAARVQPGQQVQLRMAAYPYETYGSVAGVIERLERTPLRPDESGFLRQTLEREPMVRATARVELTPEQLNGTATSMRLEPGMQFEASVEIERRTLLAWVVWPLLRHFN